jgi:hypothetical protein
MAALLRRSLAPFGCTVSLVYDRLPPGRGVPSLTGGGEPCAPERPCECRMVANVRIERRVHERAPHQIGLGEG